MDFTFWNYGTSDRYYGTPEGLVAEWKEMGITIGFTHRCEDRADHREFTRKVLDCCEKEGLKCIVYDVRVNVESLYKTDLETYRKGLAAAEKDFGRHPAAYAWYVGDEPSKDDMERFGAAIASVKELTTPKPFVNFNPCNCLNSVNVYGTSMCGYNNAAEMYAGVEKASAPLDMISYDRYSQHYYDKERNWQRKGVAHYFANLHDFGEMARRNGKQLWVSQLSVGHFNYRTPGENEIRWQINTAKAMGVDCVQWFFLYQHRYAYDYFGFAITIDGRKKEMYYDIVEQVRTFHALVEGPLKGFRFDGAWCAGDGLVGLDRVTPAAEPHAELYCYHFMQGILTRFVNDEGEYKYMLTNADQFEPESFGFLYDGKLLRNMWLPAGGAVVLSGSDFGMKWHK